MLIVNAKVDDKLVSVRLSEEIEAVGELTPLAGEEVLDIAGAQLMPGLHDHHIHLRAMAARKNSIDCRGLDRKALLTKLALARGDGWLRGFGYHASASGELDRYGLDEAISDQPVRIQHSSGKMWVVNSAAIAELGITSESDEGVEVKSGQPTGRLFRMDDWLDARLPRQSVDLEPVLRDLLACGVTSVTDTSYNNNAEAETELRSLTVQGQPFAVRVMGDESLKLGGQLKILLDEDALPDLEALGRRVASAHQRDRGVAFHCVSRIELLVAMDVITQVGRHPDDRIEHGALIADDVLADLASLDLPIITQPGFLADRGERMSGELTADELDDLYRYQSLLNAGLKVICSSDAPYGPYNPWRCIQAAVDRKSDRDKPLSPTERVPFTTALEGYFLTADLRHKRAVKVGEPGNVFARSDDGQVDAVWLNGHAICPD